ncbi:MAG: hypothetical protein M3R66_11255 [Actinomycetota bacterium]|nr:hypothetical protein [Actinomycetota bacterium]
MAESSDKPTARPRTHPRTRVAGPRQPTPRKPAPRKAAAKQAAAKQAAPKQAQPPKAASVTVTASADPGIRAVTLASTARRRQQRPGHQPEVNLVLAVLTVLTLLAAAAVTVLVVQRVNTPPQVDAELLPAAADAYSGIVGFDNTASGSSRQDLFAVVTRDLRAQMQADLAAQVVPSYLEVSATSRVEDVTVGLQSVHDDQSGAVVIGYGTFVAGSAVPESVVPESVVPASVVPESPLPESAVPGQQGTPEASECAVIADGDGTRDSAALDLRPPWRAPCPGSDSGH